MFSSLWRRFQQWRSLGQTGPRRSSPRQRTLLRLEALEDRLTPSAAYLTSLNLTTLVLTLKKVSGTSSVVNITPVAPPSAGGFEQFTISTTSGTVNGLFAYNTPVIRGLTIVLGSGNDQLTIDGTTAAGVVNLPLGLSITGGTGSKTIVAKSMNLPGAQGNLTINLKGNSSENTTLTDVNVGGAAKINATGTTLFQLLTSSNNNSYGTKNGPLNNWNSLSIINGSGSDTTIIQDTDFAGAVSINNGAGGSTTTFKDGNNIALLTASRGISVSTTSGQSDTEIHDYNVAGTLSINAGKGAANSTSQIGVANAQTTTGPVPSFGNVSLSSSAVKNSFLNIGIGTSTSGGGDFPAAINGTLAISGTGPGSYAVHLNDLDVTGATTLSLKSTASNNTVTVLGDNKGTATFGSLALSGGSTGSYTYYLQNSQGTLYVYGPLTVNMGSGNDTINLGNTTGVVNVSGTFGVTGTGGTKNIYVTGATSASQPISASLGAVNFSLTGSGTETTSFIDTNVIGAATVRHSGSGDTSFTISATTNNVNLLNNWNSLSITNGTGKDTNDISDTNFAGSVTITNGAGNANNGLDAGSLNKFHEVNYKKSLLNIGGNVSIATSSYQSDSEVYDYNVHGSLAINTGTGRTNMPGPNFVGIANKQTTATNGPPVIGGAVTITGYTVSSQSQGLNVFVGTDGSGGDFPVVFDNNLTVSVSGSGGSLLKFQDVVAQNGTTTFTFNSGTGTQGGNLLQVFGTLITSVYNNFNVTSKAVAGTNNTIDMQDQKGNLQIMGTMKWQFGNSNNLINLAADSGNDTGVSKAELDLDGFSTTRTPAIEFIGGLGLNVLYGGNAFGNTLFYYQAPYHFNFTLL